MSLDEGVVPDLHPGQPHHLRRIEPGCQVGGPGVGPTHPMTMGWARRVLGSSRPAAGSSWVGEVPQQTGSLACASTGQSSRARTNTKESMPRDTEGSRPRHSGRERRRCSHNRPSLAAVRPQAAEGGTTDLPLGPGFAVGGVQTPATLAVRQCTPPWLPRARS